MKKILLSGLLLASFLNASPVHQNINTIEDQEQQYKKLDIEFKTHDTKSLLKELDEIGFEDLKKLLIDYYAAKSCSEDIENTVNVEEVKNFIATSPTFAFLTALQIVNSKKYNQVINEYRFINCGTGNYIVDDPELFNKSN